MNVGLVVYGDIDQTSGGYRYDRKLLAALEDAGDDVEVISIPREDASDPAERFHPTDPVGVTVRDRLNQPFDVLLQDELCYRSLVGLNQHVGEPNRIVALVHLLQSANPYTTDDRTRELERRYLDSVDAAVCTSTFTRERTTDLAALPTTVAPPAGRHEDAALSAETVRERAQADPFRIAFVGNLVPRKNLLTVVDALARADFGTDWRLTVVGGEVDPNYAASVRQRVDSAGLADRVDVAGRLSDDDLESVFERSHVLAVPSRYEGFGMVYLEAMEYGVVPIASSVGGAGEFVADGRNGFLVDPDDPDRLADALASLAADRDRLARIGCRALATAAAHPGWDETMTDLRSFLDWVCDADGRVLGTHSRK